MGGYISGYLQDQTSESKFSIHNCFPRKTACPECDIRDQDAEVKHTKINTSNLETNGVRITSSQYEDVYIVQNEMTALQKKKSKIGKQETIAKVNTA